MKRLIFSNDCLEFNETYFYLMCYKVHTINL